mgnify:FL=1
MLGTIPNATTCKHCGRNVRLDQVFRSAHHDLGCVHCFGKPEGATPIMEAEKIAARGILGSRGQTFSAFGQPDSRGS